MPLCQLSCSLLSDVKAQRGGRLTPWTHLWTQPGITSDTQTLRTQKGMISPQFLFFQPFFDTVKPPNASSVIFFLTPWQILAQIAQVLITLKWERNEEKAAQVSPPVGG